MAVLEDEIFSCTKAIDSELPNDRWVFIIGSYLRVAAIRQNMLSEDVIANTTVTEDELEKLEGGEDCLGTSKLREVMRNLGYTNLDVFLREAYETIHGENSNC